jgi:hypothetical protein
MILIALAAAALAQWTGPRTEEYAGPGYFCGGGYAVRLDRGERALILPQGRGAQSARIVLAGGHEVNIWSGASPQPGRLVVHYGETAVTEQSDNGQISYIVADQTNFALRLTSNAFRGFKHDGWFFSHANFSSAAENSVQCLAAFSY